MIFTLSNLQGICPKTSGIKTFLPNSSPRNRCFFCWGWTGLSLPGWLQTNLKMKNECRQIWSKTIFTRMFSLLRTIDTFRKHSFRHSLYCYILLNEFDTHISGFPGQIAQANFFPILFRNGLKNCRVQWGKHKCWKMNHWLRCKSWLLPHVATLNTADMLSIRPHATKPWNASSRAVAFVRPPGIVGNMSMDIIPSLSWKTVALCHCPMHLHLGRFSQPWSPLTLPPLF